MSSSKIALVTGGSRGIGQNIALSLAQKGNDIIITYLSNKTSAEQTVASILALGRKAVALPLNTSDIKGFDAFTQQVNEALNTTFGTPHFDFLINNAGTSLQAPVTATTESQFDEMMNIHLKGVYFLTQKMLPLLQDGGRIVNISSAVSRSSFAGASAYAMMKGGIDVYTRYLAVELGAREIAANVVAPGAIFGGGAMEDNPDIRKFVAGITALGRVGLPDDVGGVVAFLCSNDAKWVNGQRIEVTGGMWL
ncbi:SDR family NAD(P)-dependent oxidoreductase [Chitinophaga sp. CF418]|uniref:SDR family NAD(P)-dependent oxidoreductase n=1 Tax=Chitinophaga sp. CF418 TaxID=1855287 RepID=UPI0009132345|nr:SDR family oxidoreductase [Chitinophaga sp. CF418]SHM76063.1 NAD(P)-dependent dehydrogenase, short-chain alcohol dehydrogenase family [Chitinophaga sp. CF418]